jgi:hypothetical protein
METEFSWQRRMAFFRGYQKLYRQWRWQWMVTLTFGEEYRNLTPRQACRMAERWIERIERTENIQIGAMYVIAKSNGLLHVHLLMIADLRNDSTLLNISAKRWQSEWQNERKTLAVVEPVVCNEKALTYVAGQMVHHGWARNNEYDPHEVLAHTGTDPDDEE